MKDLKYVKTNSVNPLYTIFMKMNGYFEEVKNKYLTLVPTNKSKEMIKKYEEVWSKIRGLITSRAKKSDDYDKNCMKIKFDSNYDLPLNKTIEINNAKLVFRVVFKKITNIICKYSYVNYK